jgi:predicted RNA binding protein YcfA (HicA-like mRNA interferase family)
MTGRLPACNARDVDAALRRPGFLMIHQKASHCCYASHVTGDIVTTDPMHPEDLKRSLLKKVIRDVGMTEEKFRAFL